MSAPAAKRFRELSLQLGLHRHTNIDPKISRKQEIGEWLRRYAYTGVTALGIACSSDRITNPPPGGTTTIYPGFDTSIYPGDAAMRAWLAPGSPFVWSGYYLPAPCHRDTTWNGKRATLTAMGWGLAAIYVGQQVWEGQPITTGPGVVCSRALLSREQGIAEADDAIAKMLANGFPSGSWVFLDLERMETIPPAMTAYYRAWVERMLADGRFRPGIYVHKFNAPAVYSEVSQLFTAGGVSFAPRFWLATSVGFTRTSRPTDVGYAFANIWQGILDTSETWNGVTLHIDVDVADRPSPSAP